LAIIAAGVTYFRKVLKQDFPYKPRKAEFGVYQQLWLMSSSKALLETNIDSIFLPAAELLDMSRDTEKTGLMLLAN
jgi:hypothetical protein